MSVCIGVLYFFLLTFENHNSILPKFTKINFFLENSNVQSIYVMNENVHYITGKVSIS